MSKNEVEIDQEILDKIKKLLNEDEESQKAAQDKKSSSSSSGDNLPNSPVAKKDPDHDVTDQKSSSNSKKFKFYDLERTECVQDEELLFINGTQIKLTLPEERELISNCLATGRVDDYGLLKRILENSGLAILPDVRNTTAITTNLNVRHMNVVEESISIKRINNVSGEVVEVKDRHVNSTANESFVEHVNVLRTNDDDEDETDDIRMRIFQNIIDEDSGIQDEHIDYLDRFPGLRNGIDAALPKFPSDLRGSPAGGSGSGAAARGGVGAAAPYGYSNNSLDGFYSTDLSTSSSASTLNQLQSSRSGTSNHINHGEGVGLVQASDSRSSLVYREGLLISGDLDTLIQHCMPTDTYEPCSNYLFTFLLCGRLFIPTGALLRRILDQIEALRADRNKTLGLLLTHWVQKCPYDFLNPLLMQLLERECLISITGPLRESIMRELKGRLERMRLYQNYLSLLRQVTVSNERLLDSCGVVPVGTGVDEDDRSSGPGDRSSGGSAIGGGGVVDHSHLLNGVDNLSCESPYVNMEEAALDGASFEHQLYEEFHLNSLYANNANRKNIQRISELKVAVRSYQVSLCDMATAAQVAHQLTHIEVERLAFIGPEEFVQAFVKQQRENEKAGGEDGDQPDEMMKRIHIRTPAKDSRRESASDETRKLTQNLENYVQWFNRLTYLVASDIVKRNVKKKVRAKTIDFWIEVAHECFNIGNFNSLMAITTALNLASISRLKKTWSKVQLRDKFQILEHQMDPSSNFCSYRSTLKAAMWRSAGATQVDNDRSRIIIPFFSLLVKDLYFLNEGCMSKLPNGHVNFEKLWLLSQQIGEFMEWQKVHVPFEKHQSIIFYLETRPILETENQIALASFESENPDNGADKDRYKSLKRT